MPPDEEKPVEQPVVEEKAAVVADAPVTEVKDAAVVEAPVVDEKPVEAVPEKTASLLESAVAPGTEEKPVEKAAEEKPAEEKPAEAKPEEKPAEAPKADDKPAEEKPAEARAEEKAAEPEAPPAVEYKYELPETIQMDDARRTEVHAAFDKFRANPADPAPLFKEAERMMTEYDQKLRQEQVDAWNKTKEDWRKEVLADEQIGGAGHQTAMQSIAIARNRFVSDHEYGSPGWKKDQAGFNHMLDSTGAGDNPYLLKFIHRVSRFVNEPAVPVFTDVKPAPDAGRRKGGDVLYDNDRSPNGRQ